jgi:hypothetical protein
MASLAATWLSPTLFWQRADAVAAPQLVYSAGASAASGADVPWHRRWLQRFVVGAWHRARRRLAVLPRALLLASPLPDAAAEAAAVEHNLQLFRASPKFAAALVTQRIDDAMGARAQCRFVHLHCNVGGDGRLQLCTAHARRWPNMMALFFEPFYRHCVLMPTTRDAAHALLSDAALRVLTATEYALAGGADGFAAVTALGLVSDKLLRMRRLYGMRAALRWRAEYRRRSSMQHVVGTLELLLAYRDGDDGGDAHESGDDAV